MSVCDVAYFGSSRPDYSAAMYSAYQSGQFASGATTRCAGNECNALADGAEAEKGNRCLSIWIASYCLITVCRLWALSGDVTEKRDVRAARI